MERQRYAPMNIVVVLCLCDPSVHLGIGVLNSISGIAMGGIYDETSITSRLNHEIS